jgi:branched-chain amino acid transport system substrate-binding protein
MAIIPAVEAVGVPLFGMGAGRVIWEPVKKWVFKSFPSNDDQIPVEIDFARSKGWKRVALITDNSAFGKDTAEITRVVVKEKGLELVADETYAPSDTDVTAQVTRLRAANPDLVLNLAGGIPTGLLVAKKAIQLGIKAPLMQGWNFVVDSYPPLVPQAIEQSYFAGSKMMRSDRRQSDGATRCCCAQPSHFQSPSTNDCANKPRCTAVLCATSRFRRSGGLSTPWPLSRWPLSH